MSGIISDNVARSTGLIKAVSGGATGKVLQCVTGTTSTEIQQNTTSFVDAGLSVTITCAATSSKVLVIMHTTGLQGNNDHFGYWTIERQISGGSDTNLGHATYGLTHARGDAAFIGPTSMIYLDSPSTTSAITYFFQHRGSVSWVGSHYKSGKAIATATEIGA